MCRAPITPAEQDALRLDAALSAVARSLGAIDLALGTTLSSLFEGDRLAQISYARESDYARERLGISPSEMFSCVRLARELRHRPLLRAAVTAGAVSKRKALAVLPLAVGDFEAAWTEAAMRLSVRELEGAARASSSAVPEERFEAEVLVLPMTPEQQDRLDAALALAKDDIGPEARRWQCMEAISLEFLSSFAEFDREGAGGGADVASGGSGARGCSGGSGACDAAPDRRMSPHAARAVARQLATVEEALKVIREIERDHPGHDALSLDARARRFVAARRRYDETLGILARELRDGRYYEVLRYGFDAYCEERLGMRSGAVRTRIWLEGRMRSLPALRDALSTGRIGYAKAVVVARRATWADIDDRIAHAARTTCQQLERESEAEQDRENRGKGTRRLWSPKDVAPTVRDAIAAAQRRALALGGVAIDAGEALAVIADHFVDFCEAHQPSELRRWRSERRRTVLMRKAGLCSVPGCSRAAVHVHHIVFRSRGGAKEPWNEIGLCAPHHLHGVHLGYLEVSGRGGERLHWKFASGEAVPTEEWVTVGDDDVFRATGEGTAAGAGAGATDRSGPGRAGGAAAAGSAPPGSKGADLGHTAPPASARGVTDVESARATAAPADAPARDVTDVEPEVADGSASDAGPGARLPGGLAGGDVRAPAPDTPEFLYDVAECPGWSLSRDAEPSAVRGPRHRAEQEVATAAAVS